MSLTTLAEALNLSTRPLKILTAPNLILEQVCRLNFRIPEWLITEMFCLMRQNKGLGLAAPQIGIAARFFITHWGEVFVNSTVTLIGKEVIRTQERCLSFPGLMSTRHRHTCVEVDGRQYRNEEAVIVQHEFDHLNGITIATGA